MRKARQTLATVGEVGRAMEGLPILGMRRLVVGITFWTTKCQATLFSSRPFGMADKGCPSSGPKTILISNGVIDVLSTYSSGFRGGLSARSAPS